MSKAFGVLVAFYSVFLSFFIRRFCDKHIFVLKKISFLYGIFK